MTFTFLCGYAVVILCVRVDWGVVDRSRVDVCALWKVQRQRSVIILVQCLVRCKHELHMYVAMTSTCNVSSS